jgi:hypothetical protein
VQLELVRSSKLERSIIKVEKEITKLKESNHGSAKTLRLAFRILRGILLVGTVFYFGNSALVEISSSVSIFLLHNKNEIEIL